MPYLRLLLPTLVFMLAAHGSHVYAPWLIDPGSGIDGLKNLYTFSWYVSANNALMNFEGMAWPYGEHIFFTDQFPLLSALLKPLGLHNTAAPLLMYVVHLSWLVTPLPLYRVLRYFKTSKHIAIAGAVGYTLLAPQAVRADGHYALAIIVAIPLVWWLSIRLVENQWAWRQALVLAMVNLVWLFTHAYLGMIAIGFSALMLSVCWLGELKSFKPPLALFVVSLLPVGVFLGLLYLTDVHPCRSQHPFGYFDFTSSVNALFLPQTGPYSSITKSLGRLNHWEGHAYIGFSATLLVFTSPLWSWVMVKRGWSSRSFVFFASMMAATALFLIACGQPFVWYGEYVLDRFPMIKAFRGIGRFAWPMYFVLAVGAVVGLSSVVRRVPLVVGRSLALAFFFVLLGEAGFHHRDLRASRTELPHPFAQPDAEMRLAIERVTASGAVAIVPVPWFHIGSEVFGKEAAPDHERALLSFSFHCGLPIVGAHLTRTSITETRSLMQLLAPDGYAKPDGLPAGVKVLLFGLAGRMATNAAEAPHGCDECRVWERATPVFDGETIELRIIGLDRLIYPEPDATARVVIVGQSDGAQPSAHKGETAQRLPCGTYSILHEIRPDSTWLGVDVEAALWFLPGPFCETAEHDLNVRFVAQAHYGDEVAWLNWTTPKMAHRFFDEWVEAVVWFELDHVPDKLVFFVEGEPGCYTEFTVDHFRLTASEPLTFQE